MYVCIVYVCMHVYVCVYDVMLCYVCIVYVCIYVCYVRIYILCMHLHI